jgi:hypothetical protein
MITRDLVKQTLKGFIDKEKSSENTEYLYFKFNDDIHSIGISYDENVQRSERNEPVWTAQKINDTRISVIPSILIPGHVHYLPPTYFELVNTMEEL